MSSFSVNIFDFNMPKDMCQNAKIYDTKESEGRKVGKGRVG